MSDSSSFWICDLTHISPSLCSELSQMWDLGLIWHALPKRKNTSFSKHCVFIRLFWSNKETEEFYIIMLHGTFTLSRHFSHLGGVSLFLGKLSSPDIIKSNLAHHPHSSDIQWPIARVSPIMNHPVQVPPLTSTEVQKVLNFHSLTTIILQWWSKWNDSFTTSMNYATPL